jgi:hypothetical protein
VPCRPVLSVADALLVCIESIRQIYDPNPQPPGLHQNSLIINTANREYKITAPTRERHEMWFNVRGELPLPIRC